MSKLFEPGKTLTFHTIDGKREEYNVFKNTRDNGVKTPCKSLHPSCVECVACENATNQKILLSAWTFKCKEKNEEKEFHKHLEAFVQRLKFKFNFLKNLDTLIYPCRFIEVNKIEPCVYVIFIGQDIGTDDICIAEDFNCLTENPKAYLHMFVSQFLAALKQLHDNQLFHGHFCVSSVWMTKEKQFRLSDSIYLHEMLMLYEYLDGNETDSTDLHILQKNDIEDFGKVINVILSSLKTKELEDGFFEALKHFVGDCEISTPCKQLINHKILTFTSFTVDQINKSLLLLPDNSTVIPSSNFNNQRLGNDFYAFRFLGSGGFGQVLVARKKANGCDYAIKIVPLKRKFNLKEVENLTKLKDQNVVRYYGEWIEEGDINKSTTVLPKTSVVPKIKFSDMPSSDSCASDDDIDEDDEDESCTEESDFDDDKAQNPKILYIQTEYCAKNSLEVLFKLKFLCYDTDLIWRLFREMLEGLKYIHSQGIIHRDIKPANIFLTYDLQVKIGDFGLATILEKHDINSMNAYLKQAAVVGTDYYMAPEIKGSQNSAMKKSYNSKCDVYSIGVVLFDMFYHYLPSQKKQPIFKKLISKKQSEEQESTTESGDLPKPNNYDKNYLKKLLQWMLNKDPDDRPSVRELINSKLVPVVINDITAYQEQFSLLIKSKNHQFHKHVHDTLFSLQNAQNDDAEKVNQKSPYYDLFFGDISQKLRNIFGIYGLREQSCNSFMIHKKCLDSTNLPHTKFLLPNGKMVACPSDLRYNFLNSTKTNTRRYTFGKIFNSLSLDQTDICAVDFVVPTKDNLGIIHEVIEVILKIMENFNQSFHTKMYFHIGHTKILEAVCKIYNCDYNKFQEIQHYLHSSLSSTEGKISQILTALNLNREQAIALVNFLKPTESWETFKNTINDIASLKNDAHAQNLIKDAINEIENAIIKNKKLYPEDQNILMLFDPAVCARTDIFSGGLCYAIQVDNYGSTQNKLTLINGGRCDKFFRSKSEKSSKEHFLAYGININFSNIYRFAQSSCQLLPITGVVIFSEKNPDLAKDALKLFRARKYPASVYYAEKFCVEKILEHCKLHCIPYFLCIFDATNVNLYSFKIRLQKSGTDIQMDLKSNLNLQEAIETVF